MTNQKTILVVEDNPFTRKIVRVTLEKAGYRVQEAPDGRTALACFRERPPDLVIQDVMLPDMDGADVVRQLREAPEGATIPILAFSDFLSQIDHAGAGMAGFSDYLFKPAEPSRILEIVQAHLTIGGTVASTLGGGRTVLVVDDDAVTLKLLKIRLEHLGFEVDTASDGAQALERARRAPPAAIVSDVLMPRLDGFRLCAALKKDRHLARIPIVLTSAAYQEAEDERLALAVGANALVLRTPDFKLVIEALLKAFEEAPRPGRPSTAAEPKPEYLHRVIRQLERQVAQNTELARRLALRETELSLIGGLQALDTTPDANAVAHEVLVRALDAAGVSRGAVYLVDADGRLAIQASLGYTEGEKPDLERFFGHEELLQQSLDGEVVQVPSTRLPSERATELLERSKTSALVIAPVTKAGDRLGVFVAGTSARQLSNEWVNFVKSISAQIAQALVVTRAFSRVAGLVADLRTSRDFLAAIAQNSADAIVTTDVEGRITYFNRGAERIFGYQADDIIGHPAVELYASGPEEANTLMRRLLVEGQITEYETRLRAKDGRVLDVSASISLLRDAAGATRGRLSVVRDMTERKRMEANLRQSEKLAHMGSLLAGVAHELNNPLSIVAGHAHILVQAATDARLVERARRMGDAVNRCARIIKNFLALARQAPAERANVHLNEIVREAVELLAYPLRVDSIQVALELASDLPRLWADGHQLHQTIVNLVTNAHHALLEREQPRRLTVTTRIEAGGEGVHLEVADNGPGIPAEVRARIFEPFFTTKPVGKGTGLGLSLCQSIIADHGGTIEVFSEPGQGAVFAIELPVGRPDATAAEAKAPDAAAPLPHGTILVVDDEAEIGSLLAEMLTGAGHRADTVTDGVAALEKLAERPYDVILSDLRMPGLDGPGLYREVERRYPHLVSRFVFLTGDALGDDTRAFLEAVRAPHLGKPFSVDEVVRVLRHVLTRSGKT